MTRWQSPLARPPATLALGAAVVMAAIPAAQVAQAPAAVPDDAPARVHPLPPLREQAEEQQEWLRARLHDVLPRLMSEYDIDMWILSMREYAEDPVFHSIKSATTFAARRRTVYVFSRMADGGVERLALGGSSQGGLFATYRSTRPDPGERRAMGRRAVEAARRGGGRPGSREDRPQYRSGVGLLRWAARRGTGGARRCAGDRLHRPHRA